MTEAETLIKSTRLLVKDTRALISHTHRERAEIEQAMQESSATIADSMRLLKNAREGRS